MTTHTKILSTAEIDTFELPPNLNIDERKTFFTLPHWAEKLVEELRTPTNKVGFILQFGFFRAVNRFFIPSRFSERDVNYACK